MQETTSPPVNTILETITLLAIPAMQATMLNHGFVLQQRHLEILLRRVTTIHHHTPLIHTIMAPHENTGTVQALLPLAEESCPVQIPSHTRTSTEGPSPPPQNTLVDQYLTVRLILH